MKNSILLGLVLLCQKLFGFDCPPIPLNKKIELAKWIVVGKITSVNEIFYRLETIESVKGPAKDTFYLQKGLEYQKSIGWGAPARIKPYSINDSMIVFIDSSELDQHYHAGGCYFESEITVSGGKAITFHLNGPRIEDAIPSVTKEWINYKGERIRSNLCDVGILKKYIKDYKNTGEYDFRRRKKIMENNSNFFYEIYPFFN